MKRSDLRLVVIKVNVASCLFGIAAIIHALMH